MKHRGFKGICKGLFQLIEWFAKVCLKGKLPIAILGMNRKIHNPSWCLNANKVSRAVEYKNFKLYDLRIFLTGLE